MTDREFRQFNYLFKRFVSGRRWLEQRKQRGEYIDLDKKEFYAVVVEPMEELWQRFAEDEKKAWEQAYMVVTMFDGKVV